MSYNKIEQNSGKLKQNEEVANPSNDRRINLSSKKFLLSVIPLDTIY